jgi:BirA family biotin operon repressor/biotin-[acetyl-CoA-carboxylase] ligase
MRNRNQDTITVRVYEEASSTQDIAKSFAPQPALIIAGHQTAGRGRLGRQWLSSQGSSVLMSLMYPTSAGVPSHEGLSMIAGVAVADAVSWGFTRDFPIRLKWPNDIVVDGKKLAGILVETVDGGAVIGVGVNVLATATEGPFSDISTSLEALGKPIDRLLVIQRIVLRLLESLRSTHLASVLEQWRDYALLGQTQTFENNGQRITGEVLDLDPEHGLIVRRDTGEIVTLPAATTSVVK